jgi:hypothetical protein
MLRQLRSSLIVAMFAAAPAMGQPVIYVNDDATGANSGSSWADAFTELQSALAIATSGDQVWVAIGTYKPDYDVIMQVHDADRTRSFELADGVSIYGGFDGTETTLEDRAELVEQTILSGDLLDDDANGFADPVSNDNTRDDNSCAVVRGDSVTNTTVFDGFTVTANFGWGTCSGSGLVLTNSSARVENCRFVRNAGSGDGGGLLNNGGSSHISECVFSDNRALFGGGASNISGSNSVFEDCLFIDNESSGLGGGMENWTQTLTTIKRCSFVRNRSGSDGGGLDIGLGDAWVVSCKFLGNSAPSEGGGLNIYGGSISTVANSIFVGNTSTGGGAIRSTESALAVVNCTTSSNVASEVEAISASSSDSVTNCIFHDAGDEVAGGPTITYSNVQSGGLVGSGNIDEPPQFAALPDPGVDGMWGTADDDYGDLHLSAGSPSRDAGDNLAVPADVADLDDDGNQIEPTPLDLGGATRFADDPLTPDTGSGTPPLVDMGAYELIDCNDNDVDDSQDINNGTSVDCESNGIPDECETLLDCNTNGIQDTCDIADGTSVDCNLNEVPDECESQADCDSDGDLDFCQIFQGVPDCNSNDVPDVCDLNSGTSADCNSNATPDECESLGDCDSDGTLDICEIFQGATDCDGNGVPDECELDTDGDGVLDVCDNCALANPDQADCQPNGVGDVCDLDSGTSEDCNSNLVPDECEPDDYCECGPTPGCDGDLVGEFGNCTLDGVANIFDTMFVLRCINGIQQCPNECDVNCDGVVNLLDAAVPRCQFAGECVGCEGLGPIGACCYEFEGIPNCSPSTEDFCLSLFLTSFYYGDGTTCMQDDCDADGTLDACEEDCNGNGVPDECEPTNDCNSNGIPDYCEPDCDANGLADECDIDGGAPDCNGNGVLDMCEFIAGEPDCNNNGTPDECDIIAGTIDCNMNGIPDTCDIAGGAANCNSNGVPDECELAGNDCNFNSVPDECEIDCNANSVPDDCDIAAATSLDCNVNDVPDECDPDTDCDTNGVLDICEIGTADCNYNGLIDACEGPAIGSLVYVASTAVGQNDGSSWGDAFTDLQSALCTARRAPSVVEIWVKQGIYKPDPSDRSKRFDLVSGVNMYGGFNGTEAVLEDRTGLFNETILSGDLVGDDPDSAFIVPDDLVTHPERSDNSYQVVTYAEGIPGVIDGFVIQGGNGTDGGGIFVGEDLVIRNCTIRENAALGLGGGVYLSDPNETLALENCVLANNYSGARGGGIYANLETVTTMTNCQFSGNYSDGEGGAVWGESANLTITNCTVVGNMAGLTGGGGVGVEGDAAIIITNSILWGNTSQGGSNSDELAQLIHSGPTVVTHSCIQNILEFVDVTNTGVDPMFVDVDGADDLLGTLDDDLRLSFGSALIDAGNNDADTNAQVPGLQPLLPTDLLGGARIVDGDSDTLSIVDLGAYEFPINDTDSVDQGETTTLNPGGGTDDAEEEALVVVTNESGDTGESVVVSETEENPHPDDNTFGAVGTGLSIETTLQDGELFLVVSIPYSDGDLNGADPLSIDLKYYDTTTGLWELAVAANTVPSPGHPGPIGDRHVDVGAAPGLLSEDLGDYGLYWDPVDLQGFVWANVDHTTDFQSGWQDCNGNGFVDDNEVLTGITPDCNGNGHPDDCDIAAGTSLDCAGEGIPDECEPDCNNSGIADSCDIVLRMSEDCAGDGVPDECETDCDQNSTADSCDLLSGTHLDCNTNGVPDECDIAANDSMDCDANSVPDECDPDCNTNSMPDACDITTGTSLDCNANDVPDECEQDCDSNGTPDECDVMLPENDCNGNTVPDDCEADCNSSGAPDDCDISSAFSSDCNANGAPDECDIAAGVSMDCNVNGVPDECDPDCNTNGTPDECDITSGTSPDCNATGIPDECETDCNSNSVPDDCDIMVGDAADCDANGVPDECDQLGYGDLNDDGIRDLVDITCVINAFIGTTHSCLAATVDLFPCTPDGAVTLDDVLAVIDAFAGNPRCPEQCE